MKQKVKRALAGLLAVVMILTSGNMSGMTAFAEEGDPEAAGPIAKITSMEMLEVATGGGQWDEKSYDGSEESRGMDTSKDDDIVRSFDTITYKIKSEYVNEDAQTYPTSPEGKIVYQFSIPQSDYELGMTVDEKASSPADWTDEQVGDKHVYTATMSLVDNSGSGVVIPGWSTMSFVLNVGAKTQGETIKPEIKAWMEKNEKQAQDITESVKTVTVTSKPMMNVVLKSEIISGLNEYDMSAGNYEANQTVGVIDGYKKTYGFALELRTDKPSKGMIGMEYPNEDKIEFDVDLSSTYAGNDLLTAENAGFMPLLYSVDRNSQANGRVNGIPYTGIEDRNVGVEDYCDNSGSVTAVQNGNKIHFTVTGYKIGKFPETNSMQSKLATGEYVFSAFQFSVIQPYQNVNDTIKNLQNTFSEGGTLQIDAIDTNFTVTGKSGKESKEQTIYDTDDKESDSVALRSGTTANHEIFFSTTNNWTEGTDYDAETKKNGGSKANGTDTAAVGGSFAYTINFNHSSVGTKDLDNQPVAVDQLVTFDDAALEYPAQALEHTRSASKYKTFFALTTKYAGKIGGWDHNGLMPSEEGYDAEQKSVTVRNAAEKGIEYFDTLEELTAKGYTCVGALYSYRGINTEEGNPSFLTQTEIKARDDLELPLMKDGVEYYPVYMITVSSAMYSASTVKNAVGEDYTFEGVKKYVQSDAMNTASLTPTLEINSGTGYDKADYDESGYIGHESANWDIGDSIYIVPYLSQIDKKVLYTEDGTTSEDDDVSINLNKGNYYVDYVLSPSFRYAQNINVKKDSSTDVTIVDTLPKNLVYVPGSAKIGGTYTPGEGTYGTSTGEPVKVEMEENENGETVLTMTFHIDSLEHAMDTNNADDYKIRYSCHLGKIDDESEDAEGESNDTEDSVIKHNDSFTNKVSIQTTEDKRVIKDVNNNYSEAKVTVVKTEAFSLHKTGKDALDGKVIVQEGDRAGDTGYYNLNYENTTSTAVKDNLTIDQLPQKSNTMKGKYTITDITLNDKITSEKAGNYEIYYTSDTKYADYSSADIATISYDEIHGDNWQQASVVYDTEKHVYRISGEGLTGKSLAELPENEKNWPVLIAVYAKEIPGNSSMNVRINYDSIGNEGDSFTNTLVSNTIVSKASTKVYTRTVSGYVWYEKPGENNSQLDDKDQKLENIKVVLRDEAGNKVAETKTDKDGFYEFRQVSAGKFYVSFEDISNEDISDEELEDLGLVTTKANGVANSVNSKAYKEEGTEYYARTDVFEMPTIAQMKEEGITTYDQKYENAGVTSMEYIDITGTKVWKDRDNFDGIRPDEITVNLLANGKKVTSAKVSGEGNTWTYEFKHQPKYANNEEITYSVEEIKVDGYETSVDGFTITNTHKTEYVRNITGNIWYEGPTAQDDKLTKGEKPDTPIKNITVTLHKEDGSVVKTAEVDDNGHYEFTNVDAGKYYVTFENPSVDGVTEQLTEVAKGVGEDKESSKAEVKDGVNRTDLIEMPTDEKMRDDKITEYTKPNQNAGYTSMEYITVSGTKVWVDDNNIEGKRPGEIKINVLNKDKVVDTITVKGEGDSWNFTSKKLPKYENNEEIVYTLQEAAVDGYTSVVDNATNTITNTHDVTYVRSISGNIWYEGPTAQDDKLTKGENSDTPVKNITVTLHKEDGSVVKTAEVDDNGHYEFTNVDAGKYYVTFENPSVDGVTEQLTEVAKGVGEDKESSKAEVKDGVNRTDLIEMPTDEKMRDDKITEYTKPNQNAGYTSMEYITVSGTKVWVDADNADGIRPESITVNVLNGDKVVDTITVKGEGNTWKFESERLPKYADNEEIVYTLEEVAVEGYTTVVDSNVITNTHTPKKPETPDQPKNPDKPSVNNGKTTTSQTTGSVKTTVSPKTGDNTPWEAWLFMMIICAAVIVVVSRRKRYED